MCVRFVDSSLCVCLICRQMFVCVLDLPRTVCGVAQSTDLEESVTAAG